MRFKSERSDLVAEAVPGDMTVDLGEVKMNNVIGPVRFKTGTRDMHVTDVTNSLELDINRGDIEIAQSKTPLPKLDIHSHNGDITLALPEKAYFDLDGTARQGDINNDYGDALTATVEGKGGTLKGKIGNGPEIKLIKCESVVKNQEGEVIEIHCTYDPATRGGNAPDGRKVKSTIHWVSAAHAVDAEVRLYDTLFTTEDPNAAPEGEDFTVNLNPASLEVLTDCKLEPALARAASMERFQFERLGYFCVDLESAPGKPIFNRTVALKDTWAKIEKRGKGN